MRRKKVCPEFGVASCLRESIVSLFDLVLLLYDTTIIHDGNVFGEKLFL